MLAGGREISSAYERRFQGGSQPRTRARREVAVLRAAVRFFLLRVIGTARACNAADDRFTKLGSCSNADRRLRGKRCAGKGLRAPTPRRLVIESELTRERREDHARRPANRRSRRRALQIRRDEAIENHLDRTNSAPCASFSVPLTTALRSEQRHEAREICGSRTRRPSTARAPLRGPPSLDHRVEVPIAMVADAADEQRRRACRACRPACRLGHRLRGGGISAAARSRE